MNQRRESIYRKTTIVRYEFCAVIVEGDLRPGLFMRGGAILTWRLRHSNRNIHTEDV